MRKMVTLTVSVPRPGEGAAGAIAGRLDPIEEPPKSVPEQTDEQSRLARVLVAVGSAARDLPERAGPLDWVPKLLGAVAVVTLVVFGVHALMLSKQSITTDAKDASTAPAAPATLIAPVKPDLPAVVVALPAQSVLASRWIPVLLFVAGLTLLGGALVVVARQVIAPTREVEFGREPKDTEDFKAAVEACAALMPDNPRDIVRLLNRMRMLHLVQAPQHAARDGRDPYDGTPLDERECISLTALQHRHPDAFGARTLDERVIPQAKAFTGTSAAAFYRAFGELRFDAVAEDIEQLDGAMSHVADAGKLRRYLSGNYFELESLERLRAEHDAAAGDKTGDRGKSQDGAASGADSVPQASAATC